MCIRDSYFDNRERAIGINIPLLEELGFYVYVAKTSYEAMRILKSTDIALLFVELAAVKAEWPIFIHEFNQIRLKISMPPIVGMVDEFDTTHYRSIDVVLPRPVRVNFFELIVGKLLSE